MAADKMDKTARGTRESSRVSRRTLLKGGLALGAAGTAGMAGLSSSAGASIERALSMEPASSNPTLNDIRHFVILMQENRSFDHYFGTLSGVRGFDDPEVARFRFLGQRVPGLAAVRLPAGRRRQSVGLQWSLSTCTRNFLCEVGPTTNDISNESDTQHYIWNDGPMDIFVVAHLAAVGPQNIDTGRWGTSTAPDIPFYYALADAFTICDNYHCSVLGPTDPNRIMALSGSMDPAGSGGGPSCHAQDRTPLKYGSSPGPPCPSGCWLRA